MDVISTSGAYVTTCPYLKGAIELSILSEYYGREIAAYDIQTMRCDLYGQVKWISVYLSYFVDALL